MELVYLWVEEYKNIKNQGFNFSPKFNCDYDGETLTIEDNVDENGNKQYIDNFFGDNINVTAIVGKNGSGKSNILESLICIGAKGTAPWDNYKMCAVFFDRDKDLFCTDGINCFVEIKHSKSNSVKCSRANNSPFLFHYNYTLDYIENKEHNIDFNKLYHKTDNYNTPVLLQPNKANREIDNWLMDYLANKDILNFLINRNISIENIEDFFIPKICKLDFSFSNIYKSKDTEIFKKLNIKYGEENVNYMHDISSLTKDELIHLTRMYIVRKTIEGLDIVKDVKYKECLERLVGAVEYMEGKSFNNLYNDTIAPHKIKKIKDSFLFIDYINQQNLSFRIDSKIKINQHRELLLVLAPWIDIEFFNRKDISFKSLSYGQKFLIKFLYSILNQLNNIDPYDKYTSIILLLDEVELGLHPQWQKEYLSLLINVLKQYTGRYRFNIICSSHSPFIISDLPKGNVIFLKGGKNDMGIKHKETFGANIHTLLSDSFFMEDGLIGEFAKNKIRTIKVAHRYILHRHKRKTLFTKPCKKSRRLLIKRLSKFWQIQKIIGEPFLQKIVKNQLEEMEFILLGKNEAIDKEIARLEDLKESSKNA